MFFSSFFTKLSNQESKNPLDTIILDIWDFLRFMSVDTLLAKAIPFLVVCLDVRNIHVAILGPQSFS